MRLNQRRFEMRLNQRGIGMRPLNGAASRVGVTVKREKPDGNSRDYKKTGH